VKGRRGSPKKTSAGRSTSKAVIALAVMGAIVVVYGWNSVFLSSKSKAKSAVQKEIAAAKTAEQGLRSNLAQLRKLAADTQSREAELARLDRLIPAEADVAGAILTIDATAKEAQVGWSTFTPAPLAAGTAGGPPTLGLTIRVGGTFHQILDYLGRLESLDRLVVVDSLSLTAGSTTDGSAGLEADLKARMFATKGPSLPAKAGAKPAGNDADTGARPDGKPDAAALSKDGQ
jgi:Tfp pilus assembly protein PilO